MTPAMQIALTATPLAGYFYAVGLLHSGKRPRVISGPTDVGLLVLGLGSLIAFGPFGRVVLSRMVGVPIGTFAWVVWAVVVGLWGLVLAGSASLRMTIYHVDPGDLDRAIRLALSQLDGHFTPTLNGFEDMNRGVGIRIKVRRTWRTGVVETYGRQPEVLLREFTPKLEQALSKLPQASSGVSHAMFGLACMTMMVPVAGFFVANPRAKDAFRTLLHSFRFW